MTITLFWDTHSHGTQKEKWSKIYIEAPEDIARKVFFAKFQHNADRVSCTCCGPDYSVSEDDTFAEASAYHRNVPHAYNPKNKDEYGDIEPGESLPKGWVWGESTLIKAKCQRFENGRFDDTMSVEYYLRNGDCLFIDKKEVEDILSQVGQVDIPRQGWVWVEEITCRFCGSTYSYGENCPNCQNPENAGKVIS